MTSKCLRFAVCTAVTFASGMAMAEPMRGIELHPDAPDSAIEAFAKSGVNTVVVPFLRQGDLSDPAFVKAVGRWGKLANRYGLRCLLAVRLFGPSDYAGSKGGYPRAREAIAASGPCVSPSSAKYWAEVVVPRVRRIAELSKAHGLAGGLFHYQATLSGAEYSPEYCFADVSWHPFVKAKHGGDEKMLKMSTRERVAWVRSSPTGGQYYAFMEDNVAGEMAKASAAGRTVLPRMVIGVYGCREMWFYNGVLRGAWQADNPPPAVMSEYEHCSLGRLLKLLKPEWARSGLKFHTVGRLPLDYYLPDDVQSQIAELNEQGAGFLLTATDSVWRRVADVFHVYPPHGTAATFAAAIRSGLKGERSDRTVLFNRPYYTQHAPRLGIVHGQGLSNLFSGMLDRLAKSFQLSTLQLDATKPGRWVDLMSCCKVLVVLPGAATGSDGLTKVAPAVERFCVNGGIVIVLSAASKNAMDWLVKHDERYACQAERQTGLKQAWLANEGVGMLASPIHVTKFPPAGTHFKSFAKGWIPLAKDNRDGAYLLMQNVGRGMIVASAGAIVPIELLGDAYFYLNRRGQTSTVELLAGADDVAIGQNDLLLGVAELPEATSPVDVFVDVVDTAGKRTTHQCRNASIAGDGLRVPIRYVAEGEGVGQIVVTMADPTDGALLRRDFIRLLHDERVEILPDKSYYTTEVDAVLRLRYRDTALRKAAVQVELTGVRHTPELSGPDVRFAAVPIAKLPTGEHSLTASFILDGKCAYKRTVTLVKHPPFPTAVKILHHRSNVLEVAGKPFFPFGCYGGTDAGLDKLGVNTSVGGAPGKEGKLHLAPHTMKGWALNDKMTAEKVRATLRGDEYTMLLSWYMFDEPALNGHTPEDVGRHYRAGRAKDPYHPQMLVYVGSMTYPLYPDYMPVTDCHMMDHYPLPYMAHETFGQYTREVTLAARGRKNVWAVPQCFDWREMGAAIGPYRKESLHPRGPEALNTVYQAVVEGAGAITFFTYRYVADDPSRHDAFRKALTEGAKITALVERGTVVTSPRVTPLCARIGCRSFKVGKQIYVVAVNRLPRKAEVTFDAPYLKGKPLRQYLPEAREMKGSRDTLGPLQGKVYVVPSR